MCYSEKKIENVRCLFYNIQDEKYVKYYLSLPCEQ